MDLSQVTDKLYHIIQEKIKETKQTSNIKLYVKEEGHTIQWLNYCINCFEKVQ